MYKAKFIEIQVITLKLIGLAGIFLILSSALSADSARLTPDGFHYSHYLNTNAQNANNFQGSFIVQTQPTDVFHTTSRLLYQEISDEIQGMPVRNSILGYLIEGKTPTYDYKENLRTRGWNTLHRAGNQALFYASEDAHRTPAYIRI